MLHRRELTRVCRQFFMLTLGLCACGCVNSVCTYTRSPLATAPLGEPVDAEQPRDRQLGAVQPGLFRETTDFEPVVTLAEKEKSDETESTVSSKLAVSENITAIRSVRELSLDDLEQIALANNPTLQQAEAMIQRARGRRVHAGRLPNPVIGYQGSEVGNEGTAGQQGAFISQEIVTADKLRLNRAVVAQEIYQASWQLEAQRLRILNDVRVLYYDLIGAQKTVKLAEQLQQIAKQGVTAAQDLLKLKQGSVPDVRQAEIELNEVGILLNNSQNRYTALWRRLAGVLGRPDIQATPLKGRLDEERPEPSWQQTLERLIGESPQLQAAHANVHRAANKLRREVVEPIPNFDLQVGVQRDNSAQDTIANVQLGMALPIFYRNEGAIDAARAELRRAQQEVRRLELALRNRLAASFLRYDNAREQAERYRKHILPKAQENLNLTTEGYQKFGEFSFLRVLTARRTFFQTNLKYVQSLTELRKAEVEIAGLLLTGALNDLPGR